MKRLFILTCGLALVTVSALSCKKTYPASAIQYPANSRTIRFQLYTNQDFSANNAVINFSLFIRNANKTLLDSSLASMQIKDIPDGAHKIVIEKTVNDNSDLAAGFRYEIQNVGYSWYIDTSKGGSASKVIDFAFQ